MPSSFDVDKSQSPTPGMILDVAAGGEVFAEIQKMHHSWQLQSPLNITS